MTDNGIWVNVLLIFVVIFLVCGSLLMGLSYSLEQSKQRRIANDQYETNVVCVFMGQQYTYQNAQTWSPAFREDVLVYRKVRGEERQLVAKWNGAICRQELL